MSNKERLNNFYARFGDCRVKVYSNGKEGTYMCNCHICKKTFLGHKWDGICGDCDTHPGQELKLIGEKE